MKKYLVERRIGWIDEKENWDTLFIDLTPQNQEEYKRLEEQDGLNWYSRNDTYDFRFLEDINEVIKYLEKDVQLTSNMDLQFGNSINEEDKEKIKDHLKSLKV